MIALAGRVLEGEGPKYLNTAETELFHKGRELYGLDFARDTMTRQGQQAVLVEGYMDVIASHQAGVTGAVASMGTSLTPEQARLIRRHTKDVVFLYDADEAGIKAIMRGLEVLLTADLSVRVAVLAEGEDPDSYARKFGADALQKEIAEAVPFFEFLMDQARKRFDLDSPEGKVHALTIFEPVLAAIDQELVYDGYVARLATSMGHEEKALRRYLKKSIRPSVHHGGEASGQKNDSEASTAMTQAVIAAGGPPPMREMGLLQILLEHADARRLARERFSPLWVTHPMVRYWANEILQKDDEVEDLWTALVNQCGSPEHENFLQSALFSVNEPLEDYIAVFEHLAGILSSEYLRSLNRKLNERITALKSSADTSVMAPVIEEQMKHFRSRTEERQRAGESSCVQVKHQ